MLSPMPKKIKTVSDFQRKTKPTFDDIAASDTPVLVMNRNKKVGVFLSPKAYNELVTSYEDYVDSKDLSEAVRDSSDTFYTLDEVAEQLE